MGKISIELMVLSKTVKRNITMLNVQILEQNPPRQTIKRVEYHFFSKSTEISDDYEEFKNLETGDKLNVIFESFKQEPSFLVKIERNDCNPKIYPAGAAPIVSMSYIKKSKD